MKFYFYKFWGLKKYLHKHISQQDMQSTQNTTYSACSLKYLLDLASLNQIWNQLLIPA